MSEPIKLMIQGDEIIYPEILFNLPVNPIQYPHLSIWAGRPGNFKNASEIIEAVASFSFISRIMINASNSKYLPVAIDKLEYRLATNGQVTDYATLSGSLLGDNLVLFGPDLIMSSSEQILAEKLLLDIDIKKLFTGQMLKIFKTNPSLYHKSKVTILASTAELVNLAGWLGRGVKITKDSGVYNKIEFIKQLSLGEKQFIIFDKKQIVAYSSDEPRIAAIYNSESDLTPYQAIFTGICCALLSIKTNRLKFIESILVAGFLLKQYIRTENDPSVTLKQILVRYTC